MARVPETAPGHPDGSIPGETPPAAAIAQTPPTTTPSAEPVPSVETKGPIPFDRHEAALKNARTKTEGEITQRFQQQYGAHVELGNRFQADPIGTAVQIIQELSNHPEHGSQVISALARTLGARRGQATEGQEPQADLQAADGTLVYSAERLAQWQQWNSQKLMEQVDQRVAPLQQREQQMVAQERHREAVTAAHDRMSKVLAPYQALPEFTEHRAAIAAKAQSYINDGHDAQTALGLAVTTVLRETVMPARAAQSQSQLLAQAVAKSTGSTAAPGAAPAAPAGRPRDFREGFGRLSM